MGVSDLAAASSLLEMLKAWLVLAHARTGTIIWKVWELQKVNFFESYLCTRRQFLICQCSFTVWAKVSVKMEIIYPEMEIILWLPCYMGES